MNNNNNNAWTTETVTAAVAAFFAHATPGTSVMSQKEFSILDNAAKCDVINQPCSNSGLKVFETAQERGIVQPEKPYTYNILFLYYQLTAGEWFTVNNYKDKKDDLIEVSGCRNLAEYKWANTRFAERLLSLLPSGAKERLMEYDDLFRGNSTITAYCVSLSDPDSENDTTELETLIIRLIEGLDAYMTEGPNNNLFEQFQADVKVIRESQNNQPR